jgi:putative MATE family efflux protein
MKPKFGNDLTTGSIPKHLMNFSIPMLISSLLQTGYGIINTIWVGNMVGANAVGATQVSFPIQFLLIALATGATLSTTILVSQYFGAGNHDMVEKVVQNSLSIALVFGAFLTVAGLLSCDEILRLMNTPAEIFGMASGYLKITLAGFILMFLINLITSILRGIGDTKTPLIFMGVGLLINAILDPLLIIGIGPFPKLGLNGAAYASLVAQFAGLMASIVYLNRKQHFVRVDFKKLTLQKELVLQIAKLGFPTMIQQSLVSVGAAFITGFVNHFGAGATAAFGSAGRLEGVIFMPALSFSMAASALAGQNLGAGKRERVKEVFKWGIIMTSAVTFVLSAIIVAFPRLLLSMFVHETDVLDIGVGYLRILGPAYIIFAIMLIPNGILNGAGKTMVTMVFSLISLWAVRVPLAALLSGSALGIKGIWFSIDIGFAVGAATSLIYYFNGNWKDSALIRPTKEGAPIEEYTPINGGEGQF